ncbi:hypothetical protein LIER_36632 [Lithospermum erythrorhizon]|uniref:Transmembrane protein n=1 Tax=Lithospermum erythrorhizon TaxID=34254 RepID=A0AAV3P8R5_LITER
MEGKGRTIFYKYYGERCGGHGSMELDDFSPFPKRDLAYKIVRLERRVDDLEESLHQCEVKKDQLDNMNLKEELEKARVVTRCLKKYFKGLLFMLILIVLYSFGGSNDQVVSLPF